MSLGYMDLKKSKSRPFYFVDYYSLNTIIKNPKDSDAKEAYKEWQLRTGYPYPYHPSYENNIYGDS